MALERLTDQKSKTSGVNPCFVSYVVDPLDKTDHPSGSGFQIAQGNLLKGLTLVKILGCLVHRTKTFGDARDETFDVILSGDWVVYMTDRHLIIGYALDTITSVPEDFEHSTKFNKFIHNTSLLP